MKRKTLLTLLALLAVLAVSTAVAFADEAVLQDGNYYIKQGSKSVNVYIDHLSEAKNNTKINMSASDDSDNQKFKLLWQDDGSYKITVAERKNLTMNVKALEADTTVITYQDSSSKTEYYLVEKAETEGYYTIRMKSKPTLALTATGGKGLTLRKFTGSANQQFYFHAEGTTAPNLTPSAATDNDPAVLQDGNYYIKQSSKSVNVYIDHLSEAKNNTKINMSASDDSDNQKFKLLWQDDGSYKITVAERKTLTMNVKALEADTTVITYKDGSSFNEYYLIEKAETEGYYTIKMKSKPTLALTATGGKGLTLRKFTGAANQQFYFQAEGSPAPDSLTPPADSSSTSGTADNTADASANEEVKTYNIKLDVPKLSTQDKRWKNYKYSDSATIGKYGCLLVSCTAALSYIDDESYRPDKLSKKFKFSDGYMKWSSKWGKKRFKSGVKYSLKTVLAQLEDGKPVLVHGYNKTNGHHWAVITGVKGDGTKRAQFTVMDPSFKNIKDLSQFLKKFPNSKKLVTIKE